MSDDSYSRRAAAMARTKQAAMPSVARPIRQEAAREKSKRLWAAAWKKINAERSQQLNAAAPDPTKVAMWRRALRRRD